MTCNNQSLCFSTHINCFTLNFLFEIGSKFQSFIQGSRQPHKRLEDWSTSTSTKAETFNYQTNKTALVDSLRMSPEKSKVKNKKKQPGRNNFSRQNNVLRIYLLLFSASTGALGSEPTILCSRDNPQKLFSRRPP